jgi:hypothetical protein
VMEELQKLISPTLNFDVPPDMTLDERIGYRAARLIRISDKRARLLMVGPDLPSMNEQRKEILAQPPTIIVGTGKHLNLLFSGPKASRYCSFF